MLCPAVQVQNVSLLKFILEVSSLGLGRCIPDSQSLSAATLKLSLIDFIFKYLSAMVMLKAKLELTYVLRCIGKQYSVTMDMIVQPLPYILHTIIIFQFISLYPVEHGLISFWNRLVFVVRQAEAMIETQVKFFKALSDSLRMCRGNRNYLRFWGKMHLLLFLFHNMNDWFLPPDDAMNSFLIDGPIRASLFIELGL